MSKTKKQATPAIPYLTSIAGIKPGLTTITTSSLQQALLAKNIFEQAVLKQEILSGVKMPDVKEMRSLHAGLPMQLTLAKAFIDLNKDFESKVDHVYDELPSRSNFDYLSDAGQLVLTPIIKKLGRGVLTITQVISGALTSSMSVSLINVNNEAKRAKTCVFMFIVCDTAFSKSSLQPLCDFCIEITACEPDVGYDLALAIEFVGLKEMGMVGIGKTMYQIKSSKGKLLLKHRPFIASDLETRAMWVMRQQKMTLDAIGKHFGGLHKSNVSKRLKGLPNPPGYKVDSSWLERYIEETESGVSD